MDPTQNGRHSGEEVPLQQGLFDNAERVPPETEVKTRLSAHANFPPSPESKAGYRLAQEREPDGQRPVLIEDRPEPGEPLWLRRAKLIVFVLFCVELGLFLAVAPWWPSLWSENKLLEGYPAIRGLLHLDFVRGAITGLGLVDIWLGIREAVNYRESRDVQR